MSEFKIWDELLECFHLDGRVELKNGTLLPTGNDYTLVKAIGIKDINNKNIYADSSIVEFEIQLSDGECCGKYKLNGFFRYDSVLLCYVLECIGFDRIFIFATSFVKIKNIKIIDTIQDNKLGLIK